MGKKKKASAADEFEWQQKIKKLVIIAMFSDDTLMERFVLKGGNALDLIHGVSTRASVDIDLSIDGDFNSNERLTLKTRVERSLRETFRTEGYQIFDVNLEDRPQVVTADLEEFWGGYRIDFKLIESHEYEHFKSDIEALRMNALKLGQGKKFLIDISKHEYTAEKIEWDLNDFHIFVYSLEMIVCEKLRAICQQMPAYGNVVKRNRPGSPRARDFVDIHGLMSMSDIDLTTKQNRKLLDRIFDCKRVDRSLLRKVDDYREFHRMNFGAVLDTIKAGVTLKEFDFYFDFVLELIHRLEPLGDV